MARVAGNGASAGVVLKNLTKRHSEEAGRSEGREGGGKRERKGGVRGQTGGKEEESVVGAWVRGVKSKCRTRACYRCGDALNFIFFWARRFQCLSRLFFVLPPFPCSFLAILAPNPSYAGINSVLSYSRSAGIYSAVSYSIISPSGSVTVTHPPSYQCALGPLDGRTS